MELHQAKAKHAAEKLSDKFHHGQHVHEPPLVGTHHEPVVGTHTHTAMGSSLLEPRLQWLV